MADYKGIAEKYSVEVNALVGIATVKPKSFTIFAEVVKDAAKEGKVKQVEALREIIKAAGHDLTSEQFKRLYGHYRKAISVKKAKSKGDLKRDYKAIVAEVHEVTGINAEALSKAELVKLVKNVNSLTLIATPDEK